jgi:hypothetical protein
LCAVKQDAEERHEQNESDDGSLSWARSSWAGQPPGPSDTRRLPRIAPFLGTRRGNMPSCHRRS